MESFEQENDYLALLMHDKIQIKHPILGRPINLYRIIAKKTFNVLGHTVERYEIGGWAQSIKNFDPDKVSWLFNGSRIFDSAYLSDSVLFDSAIAYGNCKIYSSKCINNSRTYGDCVVINSNLKGLCDIYGSCKVTKSIVTNSVKVFGNAIVNDSKLSVGASVFENAKVNSSIVTDICVIRGTADISNCNYSGRVIKESGSYANETLDVYVKLNIEEALDEEALRA